MDDVDDLEIDFSLDAEGRTTGPGAAKCVDYRSKAKQATFESKTLTPEVLLDELLLDCEIADSGLMPRTFWMPADAEPRCTLEKMALDVLQHHVGELPPGTSCGAEWWVQLRPSPEGTGRYSLHGDQDDDLSKNGISFHWDKDEDLRILLGGSTYVHPHLSTVTYLTDLGAPTLVADCTIGCLDGAWKVPDEPRGLVSWPRVGKHLSFDGRYLHAAPPELLAEGQWEKQIQTESTEKMIVRRHRRVTFLVNVWLHYKPMNVDRFPETMLSKMSGQVGYMGSLCFGDEIVPESEEITKKSSDCTTLEWPMGDCGSNEYLSVKLNLSNVRQHGLLSIHWQDDSLSLYKTNKRPKLTPACSTTAECPTPPVESSPDETCPSRDAPAPTPIQDDKSGTS